MQLDGVYLDAAHVGGAAAKLQMPASTLEDRIKALKIGKSEFRFR